ncbi:MAG: hypothetical protein Q8K65_04130 [Alphaproteobacteria bacterium]|nr:hypothetical protein [Alphaproteobacteria bacterium]
MNPPLTTQQLRQLASDLNVSLLFRMTYNGFFILGGPFIGFALFAHETIRIPAEILALAICTAAAYFCVWDYAWISRRHKLEPFCTLWLPLADTTAPHREDAPEYPDEDASLPPQPLARAVNEIFLIYFLCFAGTTALIALLVEKTPGPLVTAALAVFPAGFLVYGPLILRLRFKTRRDPALRAAAMAALSSRRGRREWLAFKDMMFWMFIVAPLWSVMILPGWLYPWVKPAPKDMAGFYAAAAPETGDGFYALFGLSAPEDVKDIVAYGRTAAAVAAAPVDGPVFRDRPWRGDFPHFNICRGRKPTDAEARAKSVKQEDGTWWYPPQACFYLDEWAQILAKHPEKLLRLESLYALRGFTPPRGGAQASPNNDLLMDSARLKSVDILHKIYTGQAEAALDDMLAGIHFSRRLLSAQAHLTDFAVARTLYSIFISALPHLAATAPALVAARQDALIGALYHIDRFPAEDAIGIWDTDTRNVGAMMDLQISEMVGGSGHMLGDVVNALLQPGVGIARQFFYGLRNEAVAALRIEDEEARHAALEQIIKKYGDDYKMRHLEESLAMYPVLVSRILMQGTVKGLELLKMDSDPDRARRAYILAAAANVPPEDMAAFLQQGADKDPLMRCAEGQPFEWQPQTRGICYQVPPPYTYTRCYAAAPPVRNAETAPADPAPSE